jgi:hypothetical protein
MMGPHMPSTGGSWSTIYEAAPHYGVPVETLRRYINEGRVRHRHEGEGRLVVWRSYSGRGRVSPPGTHKPE